MLDPKLLREDPDRVRAALARRGAADLIDRFLELDRRRRELLPELEGLRATKKEASREIGERQRRGEDAAQAIAAMRELAGRERTLEAELRTVESERERVLVAMPNLPAPDAPDELEVLRSWGEAAKRGRDHVELAGRWLDLAAAARTSGSRFAYLKGPLVLVELALVRWAIELLAAEGHEPVIPPVLVRERALFGTGFWPDTEQQIYRLADDELFLVGTAEVPLASLHADEILDADAVPRRYVGFSPCFRREAGAAGRDTRGIFRVHQFDKVEMFCFVRPEDSPAEHERLVALQERILQALEIPYRVVNIPVDDLGASAAKKIDIEAWLPGEGRYRELTSCSNTTDFQARRLNVRYRPAPDAPPVHLHTLNGTAVAVGRTLIALLENHQREDGSVRVPEVLVEYGAPTEIRAD
ncbi:Serine--tRNA ligase [bacterium HR41]|nr:Serine--tRNA ligase [bacterium HR41]